MPATSGIRAGKAFVELGLDKKPLLKGLKSAQKLLKDFGSGLRSVGQSIVAASAGIITPALAATQVFAKMGDTVGKMAKRTGVSVEALSELGFAAEQSGTDLATLETGLRRMARVVNDAGSGLKDAQDALAGVGLSAAALQKLTPEQQFKALADGLSRVSDASKRAALAQEIFGRSGTQLLPLFADGAKGIEELQKQARDLGLTISTETAADAERLTDVLNILKRTAQQVVFTIGSALAGTVEEAAKSVTRFTTRAIAWVKENKQLIATIFKVAAAAGAVGGGLIALGLSFSAIGSAIGGILSAFAAAKAVILGIGGVIAGLVSPLGLVIAAVAALGGAVVYYSGRAGDIISWLMDRFHELGGFVGKVVGGIADSLRGGDVRSAAHVLWSGLRVAWEAGTKPLEEIWAKFWAGIKIGGIAIWSSIIGAWREFRQYMERSFPNLTAAITETWSSMVFALRSTWAKFQKWLTDQIIKIWGFFDESVDVSGLLNLNAQELKDDLQSIEQEHADRVANAIRKAQRTPEEVAAEQAIEDQKALTAKDDAIARVLQDRNQAIADAQKELTDAQDEFSRATKEASAARARTLANTPPRGSSPPDSAVPDLASRAEAAAAKISVQGIFNPAAIRALSGGRDELVRLGTQQRDLLRTVVRQQRANAPGFI